MAGGAIAEVRAVLTGFIAKLEYDPDTGKAWVGFYPLERTEPARVILGFNAPASGRISDAAGAGFEPATFGL